MNFESLGLSPRILEAVKAKGYDTPSPIQAQAIPAILAGKDVMAAAQTGTGKTAGFTLPLLELLSKGERPRPNQVRALVLTPTRELAAQVAESVETYGKNLPLKSDVVFGGVKANPQMQRLRGGVDVLVATPGRLLDLYNQNAIRFNQLEILVLDEADRMLDMGFINDIKKIIALLPSKRQNLLFSATFSDDIRKLARTFINNPVEVSVAPANSAATTVKQWIVPVDKRQKPALLAAMIQENNWQQVLVFMRTKHGANKLVKQLEVAGIKSAAIHGNKSQGARTRALKEFKASEIQALVATDIAARGIDIDQLPQVVNFELPNVSEDYVHRIGRTGRAGASGQAVSLVCADEYPELAGIEHLTQSIIERVYHDDFYPEHELPESRLDRKPPKIKGPKRASQGHSDGQRRPDGHNTRSGRSGQSPARSGGGGGRGRGGAGGNSGTGGNPRRQGGGGNTNGNK
jgi:ATP-dependent RNA helicase RhlE